MPVETVTSHVGSSAQKRIWCKKRKQFFLLFFDFVLLALSTAVPLQYDLLIHAALQCQREDQ